MSEISPTEIDLMKDRLLLFNQLLLSWHKASQVLFQARWEPSHRMILEQIAEGGRSNTDLAIMARNHLRGQRADRPRTKRKSKPLVRLEAIT